MNAMHRKKKRNLILNFLMLVQKIKPSKSSHCEVISGIVKVNTVSQHTVAGLGRQSSDVSLPSNKIRTES